MLTIVAIILIVTAILSVAIRTTNSRNNMEAVGDGRGDGPQDPDVERLKQFSS